MSYRPRICDICHAPLTLAKTGRPRKTCSDRCRQIRRRRYDYAKWRDPRKRDQRFRAAERELRRIERETGPLDDEPPEYKDIHSSTLSTRRRLQIRLAMGQELPMCPECFKPFIKEEGTGRFCSQACYTAYHQHEQAVRRAIREFHGQYDPRVDVRVRLGARIKLCLHCGKPFPPYSARRKFCSDACRNKEWREKHVKRMKRCEHCGERFKPGRKDQIYCSARCHDQAGGRRRNREESLPELRRCAHCGEHFLALALAKGRKKYCSIECSHRARYLRRTKKPPPLP